MATKEKFEEAKRLYETANADQRYVLESLFPELRESEDERIRKAIIKFFTLSDDNADYQCCGVHYKDIVAWLEKQAQKPVAWSEEDKKMLDLTLFYLDRYVKMKDVSKCETWLNSLRLQRQWRPSDEQMNALEESIMFLGTSWVSARQFALESLYQDLKKLKAEGYESKQSTRENMD